MILNIQDDILKLHSLGLLDKLLLDKTTGKHIMWATDAYAALGSRYSRNEEITPELITGPNASVIKTRARKEMEQQSSRTRQHGEVSTPLWVCRKMCNYADEMNETTDWQKYVNARVLEITCGEAPFLVSRYDVETGEAIPVPNRIGLLDRKLQAVNENVQMEEEWLKWAFRAFWATYGYEFQGDNVLIARVNLLMTFEEYLLDRWKRKPALSEYGKLITVITWNIWQMDGLKGCIPYGTTEGEFQEIDWFGMLGGNTEKEIQPRCRVRKWRGDNMSFEFLALPVKGKYVMKFDFIIGNPPYQEESETNGRQPPIYHMFIDSVYQKGRGVELITPARFLFNAGQTPKQWNKKMLQDEHLKVVYYEQDSSKVFKDTDIKGGVAITYHDAEKDFGAIGVFTTFSELNSIGRKVSKKDGEGWLDSLVSSRGLYRFTDKFFIDYPDAPQKIGAGTGNMIASNAFVRLPEAFLNSIPAPNSDYVALYGRLDNIRVIRYIKRDYIISNPYLDTYNVLVPKANGTGTFGETLSSPFIAEPGEGTVDTFVCIGQLDTKEEAQAALKYLKTKFLRSLLGIKKVTQDNPRAVWCMIPLQDFTAYSDIDWIQSIPEIDRQLYKKYGLDETEIEFIETHVKEMT